MEQKIWNGIKAQHTPYLQCLVVDRVQGPSFGVCLSLGLLALVRKQVGLDVGVREAIAVGSCQPSCFVYMNQQLSSFVLHPHQYLSSDVIVHLPPSRITAIALCNKEMNDSHVTS